MFRPMIGVDHGTDGNAAGGFETRPYNLQFPSASLFELRQRSFGRPLAMAGGFG
jgi:hypothetical protein